MPIEITGAVLAVLLLIGLLRLMYVFRIGRDVSDLEPARDRGRWYRHLGQWFKVEALIERSATTCM
ncbi:MAG: hypothetical protein JO166_12335 [Deltaproteobacteria bacterium]|nr:hypothetical protein [Deltaproteobacteria bacterium]